MDPNAYLALRALSRIDEEERLRALRLSQGCVPEPNDVTVERAMQGRAAAALSRLHEHWLSRSPRVSRPAEPSGI